MYKGDNSSVSDPLIHPSDQAGAGYHFSECGTTGLKRDVHDGQVFLLDFFEGG